MQSQMYAELVTCILNAFENRVLRIVLYGSVARGEDTAESDVDIAVFVPSRMDRETEERLSDAVVDLNLKYDKVFSVIDIDEQTYLKWRKVTPFYQNVDREGITLWTAA